MHAKSEGISASSILAYAEATRADSVGIDSRAKIAASYTKRCLSRPPASMEIAPIAPAAKTAIVSAIERTGTSGNLL